MQIIINVLLFLLGIHLTMQLLVSLYRIIDLWYRMDDFLFSIVRSIILRTLILILIGWYLEGSHERAYIWGCLFFLVYHIAIFWLFQAALRFKKWRQEW